MNHLNLLNKLLIIHINKFMVSILSHNSTIPFCACTYIYFNEHVNVSDWPGI